jgi:hypothetical protein
MSFLSHRSCINVSVYVPIRHVMPTPCFDVHTNDYNFFFNVSNRSLSNWGIGYRAAAPSPPPAFTNRKPINTEFVTRVYETFCVICPSAKLNQWNEKFYGFLRGRKFEGKKKGQRSMTCRKINKNALQRMVNSCVHCYSKAGRLTTGLVELTSYLPQLGANYYFTLIMQ